MCEHGLHRQARRGGRQAAGVRGAARQRARHQEPHAGAPRPLSRGATRRRSTAAGGHVHWARTAEEARGDHPGHLPQGGRPNGHQGQEHDLRGDRPQRPLSRPHGIQPVETDLGEYIIQLRASCPSHIIAPGGASQRRRRWRATFAASTPISTRRATCREPVQLLTEARGVSARALPRRRCRHHRRATSWSPRPARRSSSPTRATAT